MRYRSLKNTIALMAVMACAFIYFTGCTVSVTLSGASIHPSAQTVSISYFPNNATLVSPLLSSTLTDALQDKFDRQTRLTQVRENGDLHLEGEIINYTSTPSSISEEQAVMNRLTISVRVRFFNSIEPEQNYERTFSSYQDYPSSQSLTSIESSLIPEIVDILVEDIFNAAVSNW